MSHFIEVPQVIDSALEGVARAHALRVLCLVPDIRETARPQQYEVMFDNGLCVGVNLHKMENGLYIPNITPSTPTELKDTIHVYHDQHRVLLSER